MWKKANNGLKNFFIRLLYGNDTRLLTMPGKKDRDWFMVQALVGTVFALMTGATYLTGLFNKVNAPETLIGYIPIIGTVAGMVTIFAGFSMQHVKSRRKFVLISNIIVKTFVVLIAWIPLIFPDKNAAYIMIILALIAYALNSFMNIAINSWFVDLINVKIRGRYMGIRNMVALLANFTIPIIVSAYIDSSPDEYTAIVIVFTIGWLVMWAEWFSFYKINEPAMTPVKNKIKLKDVFVVPVKNKEFMKFMALVSSFYFIWYMAMSYNVLYQLNYLKLTYTFISAASVFGVLVQFIWYPIIGKIVDRHNTDLLLLLCFVVYFIDSLVWGLTNDSSKYVMTFIANASGAIAAPFFSLTLFRKKYDIIPQQERALYDGFYTAIIALIIAIAPIFGSMLKDKVFVNIQPFRIFEIPQFQLMFLTTNLLLLILLLVNGKKIITMFKQEKSVKFDNETDESV